MSIHKQRMTMKAFVASEFGHFQLVCMSHSSKLNSRVNKVHEKALRIVYQGYRSSFTELQFDNYSQQKYRLVNY